MTETKVVNGARRALTEDELAQRIRDTSAYESIDAIRTRASLPKDDFILAALDAGVLSAADAEEATGGWPSGWDAFFTGKPARDRIEAKARWASATTIAREAPLIEALAEFKGLTPEQVDGLFGINV